MEAHTLSETQVQCLLDNLLKTDKFNPVKNVCSAKKKKKKIPWRANKFKLTSDK